MSATDVDERLDRIEHELRGLQLELDEIRASTRPSAPMDTPAEVRVVAQVAAAPTPAAAGPPPSPVVPPPPAPPKGPTASDRVRAWAGRELTSSRLFAAGGGMLMLLGVVFLFVVAANRGWVGPVDRVVLGAVASLGVLLAGLVLRSRYGRLQAALAAVGAGIAGAYATLAAATLLYGFVPAWGALPIAAGIASVGAAIALAWSSQLLAGLALVGAAAAPGLVSLDEGLTAPAPAFALVVLAAAIAAAAPRRWLWLVSAVGATSLAQVAWLVAVRPPEDWAALAVAAAASLVLLLGAIAWQAMASEEGADGAAATMALLGAGVALAATRDLLPDQAQSGIALGIAAAVYGLAAIVSGRRRRDFGWVVAAAALLLAGVATADLLSGRSLTIALGVQAVVLAGLAWRLCSLRFELTSLLYLAAGTGHLLAVELEGAAAAGDVPRAAAPALFLLGAAALAVALLLPRRRAETRSTGLGEVLEPLWDGLLRNRASIRALLAGLVLALTAGGSAAILSGRWLTIASALAAAALGIAALATRERRLLVLALPTLGFGVVHAAAVEAPLTTLALEPGLDPLAPIASLVALAAGAAVLALTCRFGQRGIALLGPLDGPERNLDALDGQGGVVLREGLLVVASVFAAWAAGLACVGVSYPWGQVAATSLWACLGVALVVRGAAVRAECEIVGFGVVALAFLKSVAFDWGELGATGASTSLLVVSAALLAAGFLGRWLNTHATEGLEHAAVASAVVATASAVVGLHRLVGDDPRAFGGALLVLVAVLALVAVPPFRRWRELREPWARAMATGYWLLALVSLLLAETALASFGPTRSLTLWAATATALAFTSRPLGEPRLWHAALLVGGASTAAVLAGVTPPDRLVEATAHPGAGFSALLTCVAAAAVLAWTALPRTGARPSWLSWAAAATAVYAASLAVLEIAERVSGASVETDFQRGHTALSTLLGLAALGVYAVGLARDDRSARIAGLTLFGLALAKLFLYDLSSLSSITRALSFLGLGAVLLAAAFFAERVVRGDRDSEEGNTAAWPTSGAG